MLDASGKNGVQTDECVGKVHNSVYDLQRQMLQIQNTDGDIQLIDLTIENSEVMIGSLLSGDLDYVELLYDLTESEFDPLERFSGERELIFSIGAEEAQATITPGGIVRFDNPEHLSLLDATDYITISLYQNNDSENVLWEFAFERIHLIADMNHDGKIIKRKEKESDVVDTKNSNSYPFLFWVNDDDDEGEIDQGKGSESDIPDRQTPDHSDDKIDGMRDLVDFFPVYIDVKSALDTFPATEYSYRLVHEDSALKFTETRLYPNPDPSKINYEKRRVDAPLKQWDIAAGLIADSSNVKTITPAGIELDPVFLNNILNDEGGIILVEASKTTQAPLRLEVVKRSTNRLTAGAELALKIDDVEKMYRHIDLKRFANQRGAAPGFGPATNVNEPTNNPDARTKANYFTFVHGYNVSAQSARGWNAEMFKRFQRLGFNGRFIGVTWHGDTGTDYHHAVYNAFQTSLNLKTFIDSAMINEPGPLSIAGHSLGNMVVSNAIAQGGLAPARYFMINAAVPIEAYDAAQKPSVDRYAGNGATTFTMVERMTEADWSGYPEKTFAANWHELFQTNPDDNRNKLTWKNKFSSVLSVAYNFYSSGEEVVENAVEGETVPGNLWDRVGDWMSFQGLGRHAWVTQEIAKGCNSWAAPFVFECSGGWEFNTYQNELAFIGEEDPTWDGSITDDQYRKYNAIDAATAITNAELTDEELAQFGFFGKFSHYNDKESHYAALYAPINSGGANIGNNTGDAATASALAGENETQWDLLSSGIPAMSFGAAANPVYRLNDFGIDRNIDMQGLREAASVPWPSTLLRVNWNNRWLHSDIKSIALPYVHHTYDKMLEIGEFKE